MPDGKLLYIVRHAKASHDNSMLDDFDRPLTERGLRDAPEMGRRLKRRGVRPDQIVSSPARRARETAVLIAKELGIPEAEIVFEPAIYMASMAELLRILRSLDDRDGSAMLVGHNPGLEMLAYLLSGGRTGHMPTSAVATIHLADERWAQAEAAVGELLDFDFPKKD